MPLQSQRKASKKYDKANTIMTAIKLNKNTDKEIIEKLESVENKQGYIKQLIRNEINAKKPRQ